jgi:hypothetical protein
MDRRVDEMRLHLGGRDGKDGSGSYGLRGFPDQRQAARAHSDKYWRRQGCELSGFVPIPSLRVAS